MNINKIILVIIYLCAPSICLGSDSWTFSTYDNAFLECDRNNNFDACIFLLHQDFNPIDPKNSDMKYKIAEEAINENNDVVGIYLLLKACGQNNIRACSRYNEYIIYNQNLHSNEQVQNKLNKEQQVYNENKTNKVTKGAEKNTTYAMVDNLSKNKKDTTHNQSTIEKRDIFCEYTDVKDKPTGISILSTVSTGIPWLDGLYTIAGLIDDARDYFHTHTYICSYSPISEGQDIEFRKDIDNKDIKYIVFFNGALKNYYKLYSTHQVRENTIFPKTTVDYIGVIDKNNKLLRLDAVLDGKIYPSATDLPKLKNYKLEE